jgi:hypothetical protein
MIITTIVILLLDDGLLLFNRLCLSHIIIIIMISHDSFSFLFRPLSSVVYSLLIAILCIRYLLPEKSVASIVLVDNHLTKNLSEK